MISQKAELPDLVKQQNIAAIFYQTKQAEITILVFFRIDDIKDDCFIVD